MTAARTRAAGTLLALSGLLAACGADGPSESEPLEPDRTVEITADEYSFAGDPTGIAAGDTIRFDVSNVGEVTHEMQVLDQSGRLLDRTGEIPPGGSDDVVVEFAEAGDYRLICDIDDHQSRGQFAFITVGSG